MKRNSYTLIVDLIKEKINNGEYRQNEMIPSEKTLGEMTGIGRSTVRKGLAKLVNEGYLQPVQGKGYYVLEPKQGEFTLYFNETSTIEASGESVHIVGVDIIDAPAVLADLLKLPPNRKLVTLKRLISQQGTRIAYDIKYIPYSAKSPIIESELHKSNFPEMFTKENSLFDIKKELTINFGETDTELAKTLRCDVGAPLIIMKQILTDREGKPIGYGITQFLGEHFRLKAVTAH